MEAPLNNAKGEREMSVWFKQSGPDEESEFDTVLALLLFLITAVALVAEDAVTVNVMLSPTSTSKSAMGVKALEAVEKAA